ncbi:hypothetical protein, partial [Burkholderia pseudomallei]|uniref:hypothetical protein n=1 Tax=Burkholderia pseudomallei TaxID=28450 RepID=UPI0023AB3D7C
MSKRASANLAEIPAATAPADVRHRSPPIAGAPRAFAACSRLESKTSGKESRQRHQTSTSLASRAAIHRSREIRPRRPMQFVSQLR